MGRHGGIRTWEEENQLSSGEPGGEEESEMISIINYFSGENQLIIWK
jgi:hypothetical protein